MGRLREAEDVVRRAVVGSRDLRHDPASLILEALAVKPGGIMVVGVDAALDLAEAAGRRLGRPPRGSSSPH